MSRLLLPRNRNKIGEKVARNRKGMEDQLAKNRWDSKVILVEQQIRNRLLQLTKNRPGYKATKEVEQQLRGRLQVQLARNKLVVRNRKGEIKPWQATILAVEQIRNRLQLARNKLALVTMVKLMRSRLAKNKLG